MYPMQSLRSVRYKLAKKDAGCKLREESHTLKEEYQLARDEVESNLHACVYSLQQSPHPVNYCQTHS